MTWAEREAGILDDQADRVAKWPGILGEIMEDLARLEAGLVDMKLEAVRLEAAGMWPAVPTEMWEERNGSKAIYLRLYFPRGTVGARNRTYIGCKPEAIAESRRKTANRRRWVELDRDIHELERTLRGVEATLNRQRSLVGRYRLPDLGTAADPDRQPAVPKMEAEHASD